MPHRPPSPPLGGSQPVEAILGFLAGAVPLAAFAALAAAVGRAGLIVPALAAAPLLGGLGSMSLVSVARDRAWFYKSPVGKFWEGIFGRGGARIALVGVFGVWLLVATGCSAGREGKNP